MQNKNKTYNSENYSLIGIKSDDQDYKIAWKLNSIFKVNFSKIKLTTDDFSIFSTVFENKKILLIENKIPGTILFKDIKEFDFILKIFTDEDINTQIINKLKESSDFHFFSPIIKEKLTKKTIKNINNIIV